MDAEGRDSVADDSVPTTRENPKMGLALSGGGMRAAIFHLGLLGRLASDELLERVTFVSTVSGGRLGTGLVYSLYGKKWPTSQEFLNTIAPQARQLMTRTDLQVDAILRLPRRPQHLLYGRARVLSRRASRNAGACKAS